MLIVRGDRATHDTELLLVKCLLQVFQQSIVLLEHARNSNPIWRLHINASQVFCRDSCSSTWSAKRATRSDMPHTRKWLLSNYDAVSIERPHRNHCSLSVGWPRRYLRFAMKNKREKVETSFRRTCRMGNLAMAGIEIFSMLGILTATAGWITDIDRSTSKLSRGPLDAWQADSR